MPLNNFNFPSAIRAVIEQTVYLGEINMTALPISYFEPTLAERQPMEPVQMCSKHPLNKLLKMYMQDYGTFYSCTTCFTTLNIQRIQGSMDTEEIHHLITTEYHEQVHGPNKSRFKNIKFKDILL